MIYNGSIGPYRWNKKPRFGVKIDLSHNLSKQLMCFYALNENAGNTCNDLVSRFNLPMINSPQWAQGTELGLSFTSNTSVAQITTPAQLKLTNNVTLAVAFKLLSTPSTNARFFGSTYASTIISPFNGINLGYNTTNNALTLYYNALTVSSPSNPIVGQDYILSATYGTSTGTLYVNGINVATGTSGALSYSSTSLFALGAVSTFAKSPNILVYWAGLWSRSFSSVEHYIIGSSVNTIWQIFKPHIDYSSLYQSRLITRLGLGRVLIGNKPFTLGQPSLLRR